MLSYHSAMEKHRQREYSIVSNVLMSLVVELLPDDSMLLRNSVIKLNLTPYVF